MCDVIKKLAPFVLSKLWILVADWSMRWSRDTFLIKLWLYEWRLFYLIDANSKKLRLHCERTLNKIRKVCHYAEERNENTFCLEQTGIKCLDDMKKLTKFPSAKWLFWYNSKFYNSKVEKEILSLFQLSLVTGFFEVTRENILHIFPA